MGENGSVYSDLRVAAATVGPADVHFGREPKHQTLGPRLPRPNT